ncbi:hypothetical protein G9A89_018129 [Geosiphon pyriformis]|nr:hypothetical protein G9A89_018129 [Geosiphon pyriformis]
MKTTRCVEAKWHYGKETTEVYDGLALCFIELSSVLTIIHGDNKVRLHTLSMHAYEHRYKNKGKHML